MSRKSIILIALWFSYLIAVPAVVAEEKTLTLGFIGDSTVASTYGWGPALAAQFNDQVTAHLYSAIDRLCTFKKCVNDRCVGGRLAD